MTPLSSDIDGFVHGPIGPFAAPFPSSFTIYYSQFAILYSVQFVQFMTSLRSVFSGLA